MNTQPNVLFITSDQQHWNTLGFMNPEISTPNLDRLAAGGMNFRRAYTVNPTCTPTRASIITGLYPSQHGAWTLGTGLDRRVPTLGSHLTPGGVTSALIGKAHFQPLAATEKYPSLESYPVLQDLEFWKSHGGGFFGFDHVELARNHTNEAHVGQHYALWMEERGLSNWRDFFLPPTGTMSDQTRHRWEIPEEFHYGSWIADRSIAYLNERAADNQPFLLWSSFFDPHPDYLVPEPWASMYDPASLTIPAVTPGEHDDSPPHIQLTQQIRPDFSAYRETGYNVHGFHCHLMDRDEVAADLACYYGMISLMDKQIGQILDTLEANGQAENTLIIFTTDHGHYLGHHGLTAKGDFLYQDGIRVPFIAKQPGVIEPGSECDELVSLVDMAPTMLSTFDLDIPHGMTGKDISGIFANPTQAVRDMVICENRHEPNTVHSRTYITKRHRLTIYAGRDYGELYDLENDPGEIHNLWDLSEHRELRAELTLAALHADMDRSVMGMPRVAEA